MKVHCCYRLIKFGEVIHTFYDTDTRTIDGMPTEFLESKYIDLPEYSVLNYVGKDILYKEMTEAALLSNQEYAVAVECNSLGFYVLMWDGTLKFIESTTDENEKERCSIIPHQENFMFIGFRKTKMLQLRSSQGIYRLTYNKLTGNVHTDLGILKPTFKVDDLSVPDAGYKGYKEMLQNGFDAIIYKDKEPCFCIIDKGMIYEVN